MGFFKVKDVPSRRVVQYSRVSGAGEGVVYIKDESVLGESVDEMPFADKTGLDAISDGILYEVPYLDGAGDVYFDTQPADVELKDGSAKLTVVVKGGKAPYDLQWFKNGKEVINVPYVEGELTVKDPGEYFARAVDADGVSVVSKAAKVSEPE
ncbi:hypothetical protein IO640_004424 [Salmonella enterica subsp. enterica serovar Enteritidis]|nr:hypothetical protein [Salmonella enterica subsp. enterica serovar Enteritidis]EIE2220859.1 hypothetical protein [Salmonella enterica subsp. enterica serovar Enteritidis]